MGKIVQYTKYLEIINKALCQMSIEASEDQKQQIFDYIHLIQKWNKVHNLTTIKNFKEILIKHIFDSLAINDFLEDGLTVDVGSGAGLPGVPLSILKPNQKFILVDSITKKVVFLKTVIRTLCIKNATAVSTRIEDLELDEEVKNITSRAMTSTECLFLLCEKIFSNSTQIISMKSARDERLDNEILKDVHREKKHLQVPMLEAERNVVILRNK